MPEIRAMLRIALPLALAELGWMAMGVVDTVMVGRLPDSAVAIGATSAGNAVFYTFAIFGLGLMSGLDTLVSQAFGAGDMCEARHALRAGLFLALWCAPPLMAGVLMCMPALGAMGVAAPVTAEAADFVRVLVWSLPLLLLYSVFRRYLQGIHHVRPITYALVSSNAINAAGNWILIYGHWGSPRLGIQGSALSTVISRIYLAGFLLITILQRDPAAFRSGPARADRLRRLLRLGFPAALAIGFEVWVFNLTTALIGTLDPVSLAAHTIALNAATLTYMVPLGISSAAAVSVGRFIGAGDRHAAARAGWTAVGLGVAYELVSALVLLLFPRSIAEIYTADRRVISLGMSLLVIAAAFQLFDGVQTVASGALRGLGDTRTPMICTLVAYWIVGLPLGCWLCYRQAWGAYGIWWGMCLALILLALTLLAAWKRRARQPFPKY